MKNFTIGKTIGQGSFGKVKIGTHIQTNQQVAIKIIDKNKLLGDDLRQKVQMQIKILKQIKHKNIIQLYQVIEQDDFIYMIMQYAKKGDLLDYVKQQKIFTQSQAAIIIIDIIEALLYLHSKKIAHRDIKLANILLTENQVTKLTDFGLSKKYQQNGKLQTGCGSPCFAAPQLICLGPYIPQKVDVWAVGVVYFSLLSGKLPFYHHNIRELYQIIKKGDYSEPKTFNNKTKKLFNQFFETDPQKRISLKQILQHPSLVVPKILRQKQRKKNKTSQCVQKMDIIRKILVKKKNLLKSQIDKVILQNNYDQLYTSIQLMKKMTLDQLNKISQNQQNLMNIPKLIISHTNSLRSSLRSPIQTQATEVKRFQRQSIKNIKSSRFLKSQENVQNFKYINKKTLMRYNESLQNGKLQQILKKRANSKLRQSKLRQSKLNEKSERNGKNMIFQRQINTNEVVNFERVNNLFKQYQRQTKSRPKSSYDHTIKIKYNELIKKILRMKEIQIKTKNKKKVMYLQRNKIQYQVSINLFSCQQNTYIISTDPFCPQIIVQLIKKLQPQ